MGVRSMGVNPMSSEQTGTQVVLFNILLSHRNLTVRNDCKQKVLQIPLTILKQTGRVLYRAKRTLDQVHVQFTVLHPYIVLSLLSLHSFVTTSGDSIDLMFNKEHTMDVAFFFALE